MRNSTDWMLLADHGVGPLAKSFVKTSGLCSRCRKFPGGGGCDGEFFDLCYHCFAAGADFGLVCDLCVVSNSSAVACGEVCSVDYEKFDGSFTDALDLILLALSLHDGHVLDFRSLDLDLVQVFCSTCKKEVTAGSRELIGSVWLEHSSMVHSSQ